MAPALFSDAFVLLLDLKRRLQLESGLNRGIKSSVGPCRVNRAAMVDLV